MNGNRESSADGKLKVSLREEQRLLTRRRILDAARAVFAAKGYTNASVGDITSAAGINRATFYIHFASKGEALEGAAEAAMESAGEYWAQLDQVLTTGGQQEMRKWLETALTWYERNADVLPAVNEAVLVDPQVAERFETQMVQFASRISTYISQFEPSEREVATGRVQLLVALLDHAIHLNVFRRTLGFDRDRLLTLLTDMWMRTLGISEPKPSP